VADRSEAVHRATTPGTRAEPERAHCVLRASVVRRARMRYEHVSDATMQTASDPPHPVPQMPDQRPRIECPEPGTHEAPMRRVPATTGLRTDTSPPRHQWPLPGFRSAHEVNEDGIAGKRVRLMRSTAL